MTACRRHRHWLVAAFAVLALMAAGRNWLGAADNPQGKQIAEIVPIGNRLHPSQQILNIMHSRAGKPYDEATVQEDVRRLYNTRWFTPSGIRILTANEADGRVTVTVYVTELTSTIQEIVYDGAQHLSKSDLQSLTGLRKGDAMNPLANELGRQSILRKYQEEGRYYASVELVEGSKPIDSRVVYSIVEGPVVKVGGVEFVGNVHAASGRLKTQLVTKREFLKTIGGKFNPMSLELDRKALLEYYHALGFLGATVAPEVRRSADMSHVTIVYHIVEGIQYHVAARQIEGNKSVPTEKLEAVTELRAGERYDRRQAQRDLTRLRDYYGVRGHAVGVEEKWVEVEPGLVQVHYNVLNDRGEPDRVGRIIIEGNDITRDRVILNQLDLRPGQILQYPKLEDARMRLNRLGIFDPEEPPSVEVLPNELDQTFKDIRVRVKETRTGQFVLGGSVNSDAGLTGNIALNERNFDILRFPTSFDDFRYGRAFRGAGQELRIEAAPGTNFQRYSVTFREPYLLDTPFGLTNSAYFYNRAFAEYNEDRYGGRITVDRRLDPIWTASVSTRIEGVNLHDIPAYAPPDISKYNGSHFLLGVRAGINRDTRDSYIYPTKGNIFDLGFEQVTGDYTFPVGTMEFTQFFSSKYLAREDGSGRHVLGIRTQVSVEGTNAPVYERFYAGGIRSFRGFSFRGVGPFTPVTDLALGGTFSFLNTIEYQIPVLPSDKMFLVAFVDHGTVERNFEIKDYRVSVGTGLRIAIPALGPLPLALDFAVPLNKGPGDHRQLFNFSVGVFGSQSGRPY
ncbi:MAG: outer membrane protein assembly factor BamA [Planctomycetes bacterium]|nr:outer membrane protein assembly factor BamA [Planctomycetota bacterium]